MQATKEAEQVVGFVGWSSDAVAVVAVEEVLLPHAINGRQVACCPVPICLAIFGNQFHTVLGDDHEMAVGLPRRLADPHHKAAHSLPIIAARVIVQTVATAHAENEEKHQPEVSAHFHDFTID